MFFFTIKCIYNYTFTTASFDFDFLLLKCVYIAHSNFKIFWTKICVGVKPLDNAPLDNA